MGPGAGQPGQQRQIDHRVAPGQRVGVHQPRQRQHGAHAAPGRGAEPLPVDDAHDDRRPDHRGIEEPLFEREAAPEVGAGGVRRLDQTGVERRTPGAERRLHDQHGPGRQRGHQADDDRRIVFFLRHLEGLRGDYRADPEYDRDTGLGGDQPGQRRHGAAEADQRDAHAIQHRVAGACAELLPCRVADVDRGRERRAEARRRNRAQAVDHQTRPHRIVVPRRRRRLDVLQRRQHAEQADGNHHGKIGDDMSAKERRPQLARHRQREIQSDLGQRLRLRPADRRQPRGPGQRRAHRQQHDRRRQAAAEPHPAEKDDEHQHQHHQPDDRCGKGLEQERQPEEAQPDAGERRQHGRRWRVPADFIRKEGAPELDQPAEKAGHQSGVPREAFRVGHALGDRQLLRGQHHEENMREQSRRADAVGQRRDIGAPLASGQLHRLPGVEDVAHEKRDRDARQDAPVDQLRGKPEHAGAQRREDEQLHQVVDEGHHEALAVATGKIFHGLFAGNAGDLSRPRMFVLRTFKQKTPEIRPGVMANVRNTNIGLSRIWRGMIIVSVRLPRGSR